MFGILDRHGDRIILMSPPLHTSVSEEKISMMLQQGSLC